MKRSSVVGLAAVLVSALVSLIMPSTASAATGTRWDVIDVSTLTNVLNPGSAVASCTAGSNGVLCPITIGEVLTTSVQVSLGYTASGVASQLQFSLSQSSSAQVTCDSSTPMSKGQTRYVYRYGIQKSYRIKRTTGSQFGTTVTTSGILTAFQPYTGIHVLCFVG